MSKEYDEYLKEHCANVRKGFYWIRKSLPEVLIDIPGVDYESMILLHDYTKYNNDEYYAYDEYFYGKKKKDSEKKMRYAFQNHIHQNPHHWQHWVHLTDDGRPSIIALDMPYEYIIEMICDWWSFSWKTGDLFEIFDWYKKNKKNMKLSKRTRDTVEDILDKLEKAITRVRGPRKIK